MVILGLAQYCADWFIKADFSRYIVECNSFWDLLSTVLTVSLKLTFLDIECNSFWDLLGTVLTGSLKLTFLGRSFLACHAIYGALHKIIYFGHIKVQVLFWAVHQSTRCYSMY
jgi:hypothetical protein